MPKKILDIDLIEEKSSDYTFFEIDEDENNKTLKALKQSYVTSNYKDETILNLQQELKEHTNVLPKEIKLESYNKYNNALELAQKSYITTAIRLVDEALQLNPKDEDILNLPIPILPEAIQTKIASLIQQSFEYKAQSKQLLEDAKQIVEAEIEKN